MVASELLKQVVLVLVDVNVQRVALPMAALVQLDWHQGAGWAKQRIKPQQMQQISIF